VDRFVTCLAPVDPRLQKFVFDCGQHWILNDSIRARR
jgi:hypothetical protein